VKIGDNVVLTEVAFVIDYLGHDLLLAGTRGTIIEIKGKLLTLQTSKVMVRICSVSSCISAQPVQSDSPYCVLISSNSSSLIGVRPPSRPSSNPPWKI